jgi:uncharacterized membrane protein YgcG
MRRLLLAALFTLAALPAHARTLRWRSLDVTARLDQDGRLHVSERQAIVFDGDWNGGERIFRVGPGQSLAFESLARVEDGAERRLAVGDMSKVDHYSFTSPTVLRWRSRLPTDPVFERREITYVLHYSLAGVLRHEDGAYTMLHDFAFPDRQGTGDGMIDSFSLRLDLDPAWSGEHSNPIVIRRTSIQPGHSVVVSLTLQHAGSPPAGAVNTLPRTYIYALLALLTMVVGYLLFDFYLAENEKGRFAPVERPDAIDDGWLAEHLFVLSPEAAGSAMDDKTGPPEVAAMLARMTQEKKLASRVETRRTLLKSRQVLCLDLLVHRETLPKAEEKLVRAFFFAGDSTDTDKIRDHYSGRGFDPGAIVKAGVEQELLHIKGWGKKPRTVDWKRSTIMIVVVLVLIIVAALKGGNDAGVVFFVAVVGALLLGCAGAAAKAGSRAVAALVPRFALPALFLVPLFWLVVAYSRSAVHLVLGFLTPLAICAWAVVITKVTLDLLRCPESPDRIAFRKRLYTARQYFIAELRSPEPRLRDEWYPYLLAFGLGQHVSRWFSAFASDASLATISTSGSSASGGGSFSSASTSSFTGGGGAFGGAGASGGWAVAAAAMGSAMAAPSSGGGGSSSGSSSSSGGGGGGGW